ncbi:MAG: aldolase [Phycisphaerae bacterium]|nr:aldolase [Phycisphaerae bacterium]
MGIGKQIRMNRLFSHPSGNFCSVAVDHASGYQMGMPENLRDLPAVLAELVPLRPDAVTMHKGAALGCWGPYAGKVPLIVQSCYVRPDDSANEHLAEPEDAVRMGAEALAAVMFVYGPTEASYVRRLADFVRRAEAWDLPVILHVYPRVFEPDGTVRIVYDPERIAWAVRCGIEVGVDLIKVPYTGDPESYGQIVRSCPRPIVAAGGPKTDTLGEALALAQGVLKAGARGLTIGRNIWGFPQPAKALAAFKAVIHEGRSPTEALRQAELDERV